MLDASPQIGRDILAVIEAILTYDPDDTQAPPRVQARRLPTVGLAHGHMTAADKCLGVLHSASLCYGVDKSTMAAFCSTVSFVPTDLGAERLIADAPNVLSAFYGVDPDPGDSAYLFENAMKFAGWNHVVDGASKWACQTSLTWFPA